MIAKFIQPELATLVDKAPAGDAWIHEIKFDGYRVGARLDDGKIALLTRRGLNWTDRFRSIANELKMLKRRSAYLDGEIVALSDDGVSDFGSLQDALSTHGSKRDHLVYFVFDLLYLGKRDLRSEPLRDRKAALMELLASVKMPRVRYSDHVTGGGAAFFKQACKAQLEGIVSKRAGASYRSGRVGDWLKVKCTKRQEFVVGGWRPSDADGRHLGSLLLGYYDADARLMFGGKVGTGFGITEGKELVGKLAKRERKTSPFVTVPRPIAKRARWTKPGIVVEVEFTEWTRDGYVRHPSFQGVREDKSALQVRRELPAKSDQP